MAKIQSCEPCIAKQQYEHRCCHPDDLVNFHKEKRRVALYFPLVAPQLK